MDNVTKSLDESSFRWIFDLVDASHKFIMLKNFEGEVIYINKGLLRLLGFSHEDIGENCDFFFKNFFLNDAKKVDENVYDVILNSRYGFTLKFRMVDNFLNSEIGNRICIISTLEFVKSNLDSMNDVNAYMDLYNRLKVIDMVDTGIILLNEHRYVEYMNKAACNFISANHKDIFHTDVKDLLKLIDDKIDFDEIIDKKLMVYNTKSNGRFLSIEVADTYDDRFLCLILKDVTEKMQIGEIIEKSEKFNLMGALAASLIHEIKNSITSIKGFLQLMQIKDEGDPAYFDTIISESDRIIDLAMSYLGVVKNGQNENEIDLNELIEKYMVLIEAEAKHRQIEIIKKLNEVPIIRMDNNQLKQILLNIFQNSFQAIGIGGKIYLTTKFNSYKNRVIIRIADNGCGIDRENLKKVMMPLFTTKKDGTGLGLSICKNILSKYGGDLRILSKKGVGTIVNIYLELLKR